MKKIALVFGTRPEAVKMVSVLRTLKTQPLFDVRVIVTGQHQEMLDQVLRVFAMEPDYRFSVMKENQSLSSLLGALMQELKEIFSLWTPDLVLVHGDTSTAYAASMVCFYEKIMVAHVEAGLRSEHLLNPHPEEGHRRLIDQVSQLFFAPTSRARQNLLAEGFPSEAITVTGNTGIDALYAVLKIPCPLSPFLSPLQGKQFLLATAHRREIWGEPLKEVCRALKEVVMVHGVPLVFAMHKNPRLQEVIKEELGTLPGVYLLDAPDYLLFSHLLKQCYFLLTDSGGLQEDAMALHKPVLVFRDTTERQEGVESGGIRLVGMKREDIVSATSKLLSDTALYETMVQSTNPFGDGTASETILHILEDVFLKIKG